MPSARDTSPAEGFRSSGPPGRRTSGISSSASPAIRASASACSGRSVSSHVNGRRLRRANSTSCRVASDECGPTISTPTPVSRLKPLPASHERPEQQVAERAVLEQERSQLLTLDGDVAHRLGHYGREEDGLSREQVRLPEEAARAVAVDLRAGLVEDGRLAFDDRDQRIAAVTDPKEHVADLRAPLLAVLGELGELSLGEHGRPGCHGRTLFPALRTRERRGDCIAVSSPDARSEHERMRLASRSVSRRVGEPLSSAGWRMAWRPRGRLVSNIDLTAGTLPSASHPARQTGLVVRP